MSQATGAAGILAQVVEETITERNTPDREREKYIYPSSLARGCMLYIARELMGMPKPILDPRVSRILEVGSERHRRIPYYFSRVTLAREVFFVDEEYRIRGYCDALIYISPERGPDLAGFYAVELKTTSASEFERIVDEGQPKEEHIRQCQVYMWGIGRYYQQSIPLRGGIIFYENRDTLEHRLFDVSYDEEMMSQLLAQIEALWARVREGQLPDDHLPLDHWAHRYCPYLDICGVGQQAIAYQKEHRQPLPDKVLAQIIGQRIVRKQRREGQGKGKRRGGGRSLEQLVAEFDWE